MILTDKTILAAVEAGGITISPFDPRHLGSNSYDLTLGDEMLIYDLAPNDGINRVVRESDGVERPLEVALDPRRGNRTQRLKISEQGQVLIPGRLYLAHTQEIAGSEHYVPMIEGRSSVGRLGLFVHVTAGFGDLGYLGQWTLEMVATHPVVVYPGMRICQIYFHTITEPPTKLYRGKYTGHFASGPVESQAMRDEW